MKAYIISIICVATIGSVISLLAPEGEGSGLRKHIDLVVGICVLSVCISPILSFLTTLSEFDIGQISAEYVQNTEKNESLFDSAYTAAEVDNLKIGIKAILNDRFGIDSADCSLSVRIGESDGGKKLEQIFITLYGSAIWKDTGAIEDYLYELFGCEIVTAIG